MYMDHVDQTMVDRWQQIYDLSVRQLITPDSWMWVDGVYLDDNGKATWDGILQLRTIRMGGGRQNYKSAWAVQFLQAHPGAICVEIDKYMRNAFITNCGGREQYYQRVFTVADLTTVLRNAEPVKKTLDSVTHLIFNDGSYNQAINTAAFRKMMSGIFGPDIIVVILG